ncbi:MAG: oxygen-independent coproporphyrinogen III oxidase [Pseudomonadota bacterium]
MRKAMRPEFNARLIEQYGGPGPRYASYPTAMQFSNEYSVTQWAEALADANQLPIPADLSLYINVPIRSTPGFKRNAHRVVTRSSVAGQQFLIQLEREIRAVARRIDDDRQVRQVHIGGGSSTFLNSVQLDQLVRLLKIHFSMDGNVDLGLDVDPSTIDSGSIRALANTGFNHMSIGVQGLNPDPRRAANRIHSDERIKAVVHAARRLRFGSINVELIYGLPRQTTAEFAFTVEKIIRLRPDRISLINYAHQPNPFKAQQGKNADELPSSANQLAIIRNTFNRLLDVGYEFIGMDHFALPNDALAVAHREGRLMRGTQGYSTHAGLDLIGLGPGAISEVNQSFVQNHRTQTTWEQSLLKDELPIARGLDRSQDDELRARIIGDIMCRGAVSWQGYDLDYQLSCLTYFEAEIVQLHALAEDGLIEWLDGGFCLTPSGMLFVRAVARVFDVYLNHTRSDVHTLSQIV